MRVKRTVVFTLICCLIFCTVGFQACPKGKTDSPQKTTYRKIGEASDDIANGVDKTRLALKALQRNKSITREEANEIRQELIYVSNVSEEYTKIIKKYKLFTPDAKRETDAWVRDLTYANVRLIDNGSYHTKNSKARTQLSTSVAIIGTAISTIMALVAQLKVEQQ